MPNRIPKVNSLRFFTGDRLSQDNSSNREYRKKVAGLHNEYFQKFRDTFPIAFFAEVDSNQELTIPFQNWTDNGLNSQNNGDGVYFTPDSSPFRSTKDFGTITSSQNIQLEVDYESYPDFNQLTPFVRTEESGDEFNWTLTVFEDGQGVTRVGDIRMDEVQDTNNELHKIEVGTLHVFRPNEDKNVNFFRYQEFNNLQITDEDGDFASCTLKKVIQKRQIGTDDWIDIIAGTQLLQHSTSVTVTYTKTIPVEAGYEYRLIFQAVTPNRQLKFNTAGTRRFYIRGDVQPTSINLRLFKNNQVIQNKNVTDPTGTIAYSFQKQPGDTIQLQAESLDQINEFEIKDIRFSYQNAQPITVEKIDCINDESEQLAVADITGFQNKQSPDETFHIVDIPKGGSQYNVKIKIGDKEYYSEPFYFTDDTHLIEFSWIGEGYEQGMLWIPGFFGTQLLEAKLEPTYGTEMEVVKGQRGNATLSPFSPELSEFTCTVPYYLTRILDKASSLTMVINGETYQYDSGGDISPLGNSGMYEVSMIVRKTNTDANLRSEEDYLLASDNLYLIVP